VNTQKSAIFVHDKYGPWKTSVKSVLTGSSHPQEQVENKKMPLAEVKKRLFENHGDTITIIEDTYRSIGKKATFVHVEFGAWEAYVESIAIRGSNHPLSKKLTIDEVKDRLRSKHGNTVTIVEKTYSGVNNKATFIHEKYGPWTAFAASIIAGSTHIKEVIDQKKLNRQEMEQKIKSIHGDTIKIVWESFINTKTKCKFIDSTYGEFTTTPGSILSGKTSKPSGQNKSKKTWLEKYGVENPAQNLEIAIKTARSQNKSTIKIHWKTGQELVCQAGWEPKVVDYLNINKIDYLWQSQVFKMPNGRTYRPDFYLRGQDKWVEIKGFFRKDALEKWDWFKSEHPNAELWDKNKLKSLGIL
jgi:hypothetical protein